MLDGLQGGETDADQAALGAVQIGARPNAMASMKSKTRLENQGRAALVVQSRSPAIADAMKAISKIPIITTSGM